MLERGLDKSRANVCVSGYVESCQPFLEFGDRRCSMGGIAPPSDEPTNEAVSSAVSGFGPFTPRILEETTLKIRQYEGMILVELQRRLNPIVMVSNEGVKGTHAFDVVSLHPLEHALPCDRLRAELAGQLGSDFLKWVRSFHRVTGYRPAAASGVSAIPKKLGGPTARRERLVPGVTPAVSAS